jgi:uncharacterized protein (UPF0332 family)
MKFINTNYFKENKLNKSMNIFLKRAYQFSKLLKLSDIKIPIEQLST